ENPIKVKIECYASTGEEVENLVFQSGGPVLGKHGSSTPLIINGSSATKPSELSFEDPLKETGHLYAEALIELPKEEIVEPMINGLGGPPAKLKDEGKSWVSPPIAPGCRVKSEALFPNEIVASIGPKPDEMTLENKVNPTKNFVLKAGIFPTKFNCGPL